MNKNFALINPGRIIFSIGIAGLAILCVISKDFILGRPPAWPEGIIVNPALAYLSAIILIIAAMAIVLKKKGAMAPLIIACLILLFSVSRHLPVFMNDWLNAYKAMALFGGSLIVTASFYYEDKLINNEKRKKIFVLTGCILLAAFFIASAYAHFKFVDFVKEFIPSYIPFCLFFAYFCGVCLIAGGIGILIPQTRRWAALLSGIMLMGWFILLHVPRFITNTNDVSDRMGLCESFPFAGIFFVLAGILSKNE
jgi:uncharacterized membrane protein